MLAAAVRPFDRPGYDLVSATGHSDGTLGRACSRRIAACQRQAHGEFVGTADSPGINRGDARLAGGCRPDHNCSGNASTASVARRLGIGNFASTDTIGPGRLIPLRLSTDFTRSTLVPVWDAVW